ncbi:hypothetical protein [Gallibacterium sp. ZY190522]
MAEYKPKSKIKPTISPSANIRHNRFEQEKPTKNITPLEKEDINDKISSRRLRFIYAIVALLFAIASVVYWMRFIQFYYDPNKHSDTVFIAITSACTVNILAAFISIIKGLFPVLREK